MLAVRRTIQPNRLSFIEQLGRAAINHIAHFIFAALARQLGIAQPEINHNRVSAFILAFWTAVGQQRFFRIDRTRRLAGKSLPSAIICPLAVVVGLDASPPPVTVKITSWKEPLFL